MFTDFLNGFQPAQFFTDSPLWVVFVIPGIISALKTYITTPILSSTKKVADQSAANLTASELFTAHLRIFVSLFVVFLINVIYLAFLSYTALPALLHHGVAPGFPFILGVVLIVLAAEIISSVIRAILRFIGGLIKSMFD